MKNTEKILVILGPTASGKTDTAIKIANLIDGEIVSADSRLVYKDFNIGTAKPTQEELALATHHMIDVASPLDYYTVGIYKKKADEKIQDILSRGKTPIIAGGTGFYIKALLDGLDIPHVNPNHEFREEMDAFIKKEGKEALFKKLEQIDPIISKKIHFNDTFRVIRALEVYNKTGIPMSKSQNMLEPKYNVFYAGLNSEDREYLYDRINKRVHIMQESGLIEEVESLINKYGKTLSLLKTLGYKEICEYLEGQYTIEEATESIQKNTRNFAKRQLTWFRANKKIHWYFVDKMSKNEICESIMADNERI